MSSEIKFTLQPGENKRYKLRLYMLTTCELCHSAFDFLKENSIEFEHIYCDELTRKQADKVNEGLINRCKDPNETVEEFVRNVEFPFLIVDDKKCLPGFDEKEYKELFDIK